MAGQGVDDLICADIVVEVDVLAIVNGLGGRSGAGQWHAFLYRLADEKSIWGERCLRQLGNWTSQELDTGGIGHQSEKGLPCVDNSLYESFFASGVDTAGVR